MLNTSFSAAPGAGTVFLLTAKGNQKTLHRQIRAQFQGKRYMPFVATDHEISHGRNITWSSAPWSGVTQEEQPRLRRG
jgi:hypothetical protein